MFIQLKGMCTHRDGSGKQFACGWQMLSSIYIQSERQSSTHLSPLAAHSTTFMQPIIYDMLQDLGKIVFVLQQTTEFGIGDIHRRGL